MSSGSSRGGVGAAAGTHGSANADGNWHSFSSLSGRTNSAGLSGARNFGSSGGTPSARGSMNAVNGRSATAGREMAATAHSPSAAVGSSRTSLAAASSAGWRGLGHGGSPLTPRGATLGGTLRHSPLTSSSFTGSRLGTTGSLTGGSRFGARGSNLVGSGLAGNGYRSGLSNGYGGRGYGGYGRYGYGHGCWGCGFGWGWGSGWGWSGFPFWNFPFWNLGYNLWSLWPDYSYDQPYYYPPPVIYNYGYNNGLNYSAPPADPNSPQT